MARKKKNTTANAVEAYACYTSSNTTLTFYYDDQRATREAAGATCYDIPESATGFGDIPWATYSTKYTAVIFDSSFVKFTPTSTNYWFYNFTNSKFTAIDCSNLNGTEITSANNMFGWCTRLNSITLPDGFGAKIQDASYMFFDCVALVSFVLPDGFGKVITDASYMFGVCTYLASITLPDGFGAKIQDATRMFSQCSWLTSISLPEGFGEQLTTTECMFLSCTRLSSIYCSTDMVNKSPEITSSKSMFSECTKLPNFDSSKVDKTMAYPGGYFTYNIPESNALKFSSNEDGSTVKFSVTSGDTAPSAMYSLNKGESWTLWDADTTLTLNSGSEVLVCGKNDYWSNGSRTVKFVCTGNFVVSGKLTGLLDYGVSNSIEIPAACFKHLLEGCGSTITDVSGMVLQAATVGNYGYSDMFEGLTAITKSPELMATSIGVGSYMNMFNGCTSLIEVLTYLKSWPTSSNALLYWLNGVASDGDFWCPEALTDVRGTSNIPTGWRKHSNIPSAGAMYMLMGYEQISNANYLRYVSYANTSGQLITEARAIDSTNEIAKRKNENDYTMLVIDVFGQDANGNKYIRFASQMSYFMSAGAFIDTVYKYQYAAGLFENASGENDLLENVKLDGSTYTEEEGINRSTWSLVPNGTITIAGKTLQGYILRNKYNTNYYIKETDNATDAKYGVLALTIRSDEAATFYFMETEFGMAAADSAELTPTALQTYISSNPSGKSYDLYGGIQYFASFLSSSIFSEIEKWAYRIKCEGLVHNTATWEDIEIDGSVWSNLVSDWDWSKTEKPDDCVEDDGWGVPGVTSPSLDIFNWKSPSGSSYSTLQLNYPAQSQDDTYDARRYTIEFITARDYVRNSTSAPYYGDNAISSTMRKYRAISNVLRSDAQIMKPSWFVDTVKAVTTADGLFITFDTTLKRTLETNNYVISDIYGYDKETGTKTKFLTGGMSLNNYPMDEFTIHIPLSEMAFFPNDGDSLVLEVDGTSNSEYVLTTAQTSRHIVPVTGSGGELTPVLNYEYLNDYDIKYTVSEASGITPTSIETRFIYLYDGRAIFKDPVLYNGAYYLGAPLNYAYDIFVYVEYTDGQTTKWGALHTIIQPPQTLAIVLNSDYTEFVMDKFLSNAPLSISGDIENESMSLQGNVYPDVFKGTNKSVKIQIDKAVIHIDDIEYIQEAINGGDCLLRDNQGLYSYVVVTSYNINKISNEYYSVDLTMQETSRSFDFYLPWSVDSAAKSKADKLSHILGQKGGK